MNVHGETVYGHSVNLATGAVVPVNIGRAHPVFFGSKTALTALKFTQALSENFIAYAGKINTIDNVQQPFMPGGGLDAGFMKRELAIFESYPAGVTRTFPDESHDSNPRFLVDHLSVRPGAMGRHHGSNAQLGRAMN
jgi:hypothetical protein